MDLKTYTLYSQDAAIGATTSGILNFSFTPPKNLLVKRVSLGSELTPVAGGNIITVPSILVISTSSNAYRPPAPLTIASGFDGGDFSVMLFDKIGWQDINRVVQGGSLVDFYAYSYANTNVGDVLSNYLFFEYGFLETDSI